MLRDALSLLASDPALALDRISTVLRKYPGEPQALIVAARAHAMLGDRSSAITALRQSLAGNPGSAEAWRMLGDQLMLAGDGAQADAAYSRHLQESVRDPELRAAATALRENQIPVAERILKPFLKRHPSDIAAIRMLAEVAGRIGRYADAETLLRRALELSPSFAAARFNLATVLHRMHRPLDAIAEIDVLIDAEPNNPGYLNLKGAIISRIGQHEDAATLFEAVLRERPGQHKIWMSYGHVLKTLGRQADSVAAYRRSLALEPGLGEAWWSLANLKTVRLGEEDRATMATMLGRTDLSAEDRFHLHFALGKSLEDVESYDESFDHYLAGNRGRHALLRHDAGDVPRQVDRSIELFSADFFAARRGWGDPAHDPIFILGMPRAGSTLIEQILASHPEVEGTHELPDLAMLVQRMPGNAYPDPVASLDADEARRLGAAYLESTRVQRKTGRRLFVDKMPNNWAYVPLIQLILPNATIIDARRHPLACCFSNFKQHFARGQAFSYDLEELARYYADYVRLMAHVDAVLPGRVHRIFHEQLVDDIEGEVRRLLGHVGLPFDPACLRFWETERSIQTASSEQVRRPIFREGLDQHLRYDRHLGPLREILRPLIETYPVFIG